MTVLAIHSTTLEVAAVVGGVTLIVTTMIATGRFLYRVLKKVESVSDVITHRIPRLDSFIGEFERNGGDTLKDIIARIEDSIGEQGIKLEEFESYTHGRFHNLTERVALNSMTASLIWSAQFKVLQAQDPDSAAEYQDLWGEIQKRLKDQIENLPEAI